MIWESGWFWIIVAAVLGVVEVLLPGYIFLGIALACAVTGLALLAGIAAPSLPVLLIVIAVLSGIAWLILRRVVGVRHGQVRIWDRDINDD